MITFQALSKTSGSVFRLLTYSGSAHSDCCNKIRQSRWLLNKRTFISLSSGGWRSVCQRGLVSIFFHVVDFSLYPHMAEGTRELPQASFMSPLILFIRAPLFPKTAPPNPMTLGTRVLICEHWWETNIQIIDSTVGLIFFFKLNTQCMVLVF